MPGQHDGRVSKNRPAARWPIVTIRILAVVVSLQVLTQAALAGGFVTGDVGLLSLHSANGTLLALTSAALLPATILLVRPGRGPWWPIVVSCALWAAVVLQIGLGFAREVGLHIPVGMAIMGLAAAFTWWAFSHRPAHQRPVRPGEPPTTAPPATATAPPATAPASAVTDAATTAATAPRTSGRRS